jgi:predicted ATP-binding protein involved in virulence
MIDEPEISLNVKWQRQLVQSLLSITDGASIQFIFASHSMELLAQHRNRVVKLLNKP